MPVNPLRPLRERLADRRGIAMPLALLGLVVVTLLVTTAILTSTTEFALSSAHQDGVRALYASDGALSQYLQQRSTVVGTSVFRNVDTTFTDADGKSYNVTVNRLGATTQGQTVNETYSVVVEPGDKRGRSVGLLLTATRAAAQTLTTNINSGASIASDVIKIQPNATISGVDTSACKTGNVAGISLAADVSGENIKGNIEGQPPLQRSTYTKAQFASYLLDGRSPTEMATFADVKWGLSGGFGPWGGGTSSGSKARSTGLNWGCPASLVSSCVSDPDRDYFPVVAIQSSTTVHLDGEGQGFLIVLGDALLNSQFKYNGIVIVLGDVRINGGTNIYGALVALGDQLLQQKDNDGESYDMMGGALVKFNRCNVNAAVNAFNGAQARNGTQTFTGQNLAWFEVVR